MIGPGPHGGDGARLAGALGIDPGDVLDLSASFNPAGPDVSAAVARHLDSLGRYPDPAAATAALAAALGVDSDRVLLTNGGSEAISLVASEVGGGVRSEPEFGLHPRSPDGPRWRSDPHNPSGRLAGTEESADVWDEAFYPLATGRWTAGRDALVVGSLTKVFACPGLRAGYVLAPAGAGGADLIGRLRRRQPVWSVNGLAAAVLPELLAIADLAGWAAAVREWRMALVDLLRAHGLAPEPSDANFVLASAPGMQDRLAPFGVWVRDCASFGLAGHVRIAVPDAAGLARLNDAMEGRRPGDWSAVAPSPSRRSRAGDALGSAPAGAGPGAGAGALMICGTGSHAGKTLMVAGLCRVLARRGMRVAPFKGQNMALNSGVTAGGHEISRAQILQAAAAGVEPEVAMNPILLKPTSERASQVVVMGRPWADLDAVRYQAAKPDLLATVLDALADLRRRFDVVVLEGAGSPAEINLLDGDLVNLGLAARAGVPALVVGDIDRGGVFASLVGTMALLPPELATQVRGFVINKFRGDPALLGQAPAEVERRTGVPVLGVVPWVRNLGLDAEDSLSLPAASAAARPAHTGACEVDVAVIRLPHISNFTDLDPLVGEPGVGLRFVDRPRALGRPDLIVIPGTKATVADLAWLRDSGLVGAIGAARDAGTAVLGVCGGYQMLGRTIEDGVESGAGEVEGLGWLNVTTTFEPTKMTRQVRGRALGEVVAGYQIHHGRVNGSPGWITLDDAAGADAAGAGVASDGAADPGARVWGTTLHGLFEADAFRARFLTLVAPDFRPAGVVFAAAREAQIDAVADAIEAHVDLNAVDAIIKEGALRL